MNANRIQTNTGFATILNGLVVGAFTLAVIGMAGVLTMAQYLAVV